MRSSGSSYSVAALERVGKGMERMIDLPFHD